MPDGRPNIVLLLSDQHRHDTVGYVGGAACTPALDALACAGMIFTDAYTVCPLCSPARASLLTGLYPHRHGMLSNLRNFNGVFDRQVLDHPAFPQLLSRSGYRVGYAGKWHLPLEGDERWRIDRWPRGHRAWLAEKGIDYDMARDEVQPLEWGADAPFCGPSVLSATDHHDAWVADQAITMLDGYAPDDAPFMITAAFHGPHFPVAPPAPYHQMYDPASVAMWPSFTETFTDKPLVQQKEILRWNSAHLTWPDWQRVIAAYRGYCSFIDAQVGRILDRLGELGLAGRTLVIYASDHGDLLGSHRMFNKGFAMYDENCRIPLVVRWPGVVEPGVCDRFVTIADLMPTVLSAAGIEPPSGIDGRSLGPLLRGEPTGWPDDVLVEFNGYESSLASIRMVRTRKWKYVYNPLSIDELYDLETDPNELVNLANKVAFKHVLRRMKERLLARLRATHDGIVAVTPWQSASYDLFVSEREE